MAEMELITQKIKALNNNQKNKDLWDFALAGIQKNYQQIISLTKSFYQKYPNDYDYVSSMYLIEKDVNKNPKKANEILTKYIQNNYNDDVITEMTNNYFNTGNKKEGIETYKLRIATYPYKTGYYVETAALYKKLN